MDDLRTRDESEVLIDLTTGEATSVDPNYFRGVGTPSGTALLSELSKADLVELLQEFRRDA